MELLTVIIAGLIAGLLSAAGMNMFMRAVGRNFGRSADMVRALGSYFTGRMKGATATGTTIHLVAGAFFGIFYLAIIHAVGALAFPQALFLGLGIGFVHGLVMSYVLMIFASERHPLEDYRKATMQEGVLHLFGHVLFGGLVGLLGGLAAMF
ncbi:MAG: hypothetical protein ACPGSB_00630 [Opitutales bacterium]